MRRQDHVVEAAQRRDELLVVALRLDGEDVDRGAAQVPALQAAASASMSTTVPREALIEHRARLHPRELRAPIMPFVSGVSGTCSVTTSAAASSSSSVVIGCALPSGSLGHDVEVADVHAQRFRQDAELGADVAVADDAQRLAAHLVRSSADFAHRRGAAARSWPGCRVAAGRISASTSSATLRVLEKGALKTGMPRVSAAVQVDLVGADAEGARPRSACARRPWPRR